MQALGYAPAAAAVKSASALLQTALMATSVLMGAGLEHVLAAQLAGEAVRSAWQWYRFAALTRHATPTDPHGDAKNANKEERAQLTLFVVLSALSTRLSLVWLAPAAGEAAAGFFSVAFRFMTAFRTIPGALLTSILPALGAGAHSRDSKNAMLWTLAASSVAAIACTLLAHPLVTFLWGPRYLPAAEALRILSLCFPALVISHAAEASLLAKQQQKTVTATTAASLLALVAANAAWLHLGTEAAAIIWTSWNWLLAAALAAAHYAHTKRHNTQTKK
jgi:O-antigen/teichoic acid export membrane protein